MIKILKHFYELQEQMKVILSIKPEFAEKIFSGKKRYEFRRTLFKNKEVNKVIVYASAPISRVIGEFEIERILFEELRELWKTTKDYSGITSEYYYKYFKGKEKGYAIKIKKAAKYEKELVLEDNFGVKPPQSFAYFKKG